MLSSWILVSLDLQVWVSLKDLSTTLWLPELFKHFKWKRKVNKFQKTVQRFQCKKVVVGQFGLVQHVSLSSFFSAAQCKFLANTCLVPTHLSLWKFAHCKMVHAWSIVLDNQSLKFCAHLYAKLLPSAWVGGRDNQVRAGKAGKFLCFLDPKTKFSNAMSPVNNQLTWNVTWKDAKSMSIIHPFYVKSFAPGKKLIFFILYHVYKLNSTFDF